MRIHSSNSVTTTGEIRITKSFHQLVIRSQASPASFTTETIRLYLERTNGKNIDICKQGTLLRDFISLDTFGVNAITYDGTNFYSKCPVSQGNFPLSEDDVFKIQIDGMNNTQLYEIYTMEVPEFSSTLVTVDTTIFPSDEIERTFDVEDNDLLLLKGASDFRTEIETIEIDFINGRTLRYLPEELIALQTDADWCALLGEDVSRDRLVREELILPLRGIKSLTIRKAQGNPASLVFMDFNMSI